MEDHLTQLQEHVAACHASSKLYTDSAWVANAEAKLAKVGMHASKAMREFPETSMSVSYLAQVCVWTSRARVRNWGKNVHLLYGLASGLRKDTVDIVAQPHQLPSLIVDVRCLSPGRSRRVVQHNSCVWQRIPLALHMSNVL